MYRLNGKIFLALISMVLPTLMSCSFPASFVIINLSDGLVEATYEFKDDPKVEFSCPEGEVYVSPSVGSEGEFDSSEAPWSPLGPDEYICDPTSRTVLVPVGPGMALKVVKHDDPGADIGDRDTGRFPIGRLLINGTSGSIDYTGAQVLRAFERGKGGISFLLTYR